MAKGYWIATGKVNDLKKIKKYSQAFNDWLPTVMGRFIIRDYETIEQENGTGHLTAVIEFPSKMVAINAYNSVEHKNIIPLRTPFSEISLVICEGF